METIVKGRHEEAHTLINGFLQRHFARHGIYREDLYKYLGADYVPGFPKTRNALLNILSDEQEGRCCYCMRQINDLGPGEKTIEHVIVNHPENQADYEQYLNHNSFLDDAPIQSTADFVSRQNAAPQNPPTSYPHSVAYENLLMSCAGHIDLSSRSSLTCNNKRCHRFIMPLPLMANTGNDVKYRKDGSVYWVYETQTENTTVNILGLNHIILRTIRRIWHKISEAGQNADSCDRKKITLEALDDAIADGEDDAVLKWLFLFASNDNYWNMLKQFSYFNNLDRFE